MARKTGRSSEYVRRELDGVCGEIAEIEIYLEGSIQRRDATYVRKDGTRAQHKATPSLQYPTARGQGRMRIPWAHVAFVERLLREGARRKQLLARHRDLSRELAQALMREDPSGQKKTPPFPSRRRSPPASAG